MQNELKNFFQEVSEIGSDTRGIPIPLWAINGLRQYLTENEFWVLCFLIHSAKGDFKNVLAPTKDAFSVFKMKKRSYFAAIKRFKDLGLVKLGNGIYDIEEFVQRISDTLLFYQKTKK